MITKSDSWTHVKRWNVQYFSATEFDFGKHGRNSKAKTGRIGLEL